MKTNKLLLAALIGMISISAAAQTMTSSGTTGTVGNIPYISAASSTSTTLGTSPVAVSGNNVVVSGNVQINPPAINNSGNGLYAGNGDGASASTADVAVESWWGLGFKSTCCSNYGIIWNYPIVFDTRAGDIYAEGRVGIGTTSPLSLLDVSSQKSATDGIRLSGLEFNYGQTSTDGIAMRLGINRSSNRQLWIADSAAAINTTNAQLRIFVGSGMGYTGVDSLSTDGSTYTNLALNSGGGNVGIGTTSPGAKLDVSGNIKLSAPGTGIVFADGSVQTLPWTGSLCGGDYAESVNTSGDHKKYEPGDLLVLSDDSGSDVSKSSQPYSTLVTGIYSTKPGVIGRRQAGEKSDREIPMAMVGIVPTKVSAENGPIRRGDLLVTSATEGYAMKGTDHGRMLGAIVGKALGSLDSGMGVIEVVVSLQ
ncbi:tail fiber protein [Granulicella sp. dw_53]|uniref:tail fiber protein n=1 Tax=Granulicella sp. dw_53 TaxID=2719792 RepID=UPI001BD68386|nr:tail fiber protein [Granulicella sp. dw_53]